MIGLQHPVTVGVGIMSNSGHLYGTGYRAEKANNTDEYLWPPVMRRLKALKQGARVLDAGCGNGYFLKHLNETGYDVSGIELDLSGVEIARKMVPNCQIENKSIYDDVSNIFSEKFDAIVSLEVVEHLYDPRKFAKEMKKCLKPNGIFIVSTPYHGYLKNLAITALGKFDKHVSPLWDGGHIKFWSKTTLTKLLTDEGLQVIGFDGAGRFSYFWKSMILTAKN